MKRYKIQPEVVLSGVKREFNVPEIKVRFNKGKRSFGSISDSKDVYKYLLTLYGRDISIQEKGIILFLNKRNEIIGYYKHSVGGIDGTILDVRLIIATALKALASEIILSHNHPSDNKSPSAADKAITTKIRNAATMNDIKLLDHLIVTKNNGYYSFADESELNGLHGLLNYKPMKITITNYFEAIKGLDTSSFPASFAEMHAMVAEITNNGKDYSEYNELDKTSKDVFELYFDKLEIWLEKNQPKAKHAEKPKKEKKLSTEPKKKKEKQVKQANPKYKEGKKFYWRDDDGKIYSETIKEIRHDASGKVVYITHTSPTKEGVKLRDISETDLAKGLKESTYSANPMPKIEENLSPEIRYIKRFIGLNGKSKSKEDIYNFLSALQKSIIKKEIRKASQYADEISHIQKLLINAHNQMRETNVKFEIDKKTLDEYSSIANGTKVMLSVTYIKQYINLLKAPTKDKAKTLLNHIEKALETKKIPKNCIYMAEIKRIVASLYDFIDKSRSFDLSQQELRGLMGICKCKMGKGSKGLGFMPNLPANRVAQTMNEPAQSQQQKVNVVNSMDILNMKFNTLTFTGEWHRLFGNPSPNFSMMIYGEPKCKKSTLAVLLANYLAKSFGSVLYAAYEEGIGETLKEKIDRLHAAHPNLNLSNGLPSNLSPYKFIVIDSVTRAKLQFKDLVELKRKYPNAAFIFIMQVTKDGNYRGSQEIEHEVDIVVHCDANQVAHSNGRFSQGGEMQL